MQNKLEPEAEEIEYTRLALNLNTIGYIIITTLLLMIYLLEHVSAIIQ